MRSLPRLCVLAALLMTMAAAPDLDVRYVARLARLELSDAEIAQYQAQLSDVLKFVEALRQVDVSDVEPTAHASPVFT